MNRDEGYLLIEPVQLILTTLEQMMRYIFGNYKHFLLNVTQQPGQFLKTSAMSRLNQNC